MAEERITQFQHPVKKRERIRMVVEEQCGGAKVSFLLKKEVWRFKRGAEEKDSACKVPACVTEEYNKNCD